MAEITMSLDEYEQLRAMALNGSCMNCQSSRNDGPMQSSTTKRKRKKSAYNKKYAAAFKKVQKKYKKKSGGWMKDGFKRAQREAHRIARRSR